MLDVSHLKKLNEEIKSCMENNREILDELRREIKPLAGCCRRIQSRSTTSISLVATDGGNNSVEFDPYLIHIIRVVDSSNNQYHMEVLTPTTPPAVLTRRHIDEDGTPKTPLGDMMISLGVKSLEELSPMIPRENQKKPVSVSWIQVYRELVEWSILLKIIDKDFATDTVILFDGFLRSKIFRKELFAKYLDLLNEKIEVKRRNNRRLYIAGIAKHSKVLSRYRAAMILENVLTNSWPEYVEVPRELEEKSYKWAEYARGNDRVVEGSEANKFVGGKLFFVKFGNSKYDPIWPIDIFLPQVNDAQLIFGSLLNDAISGFPIPFYPMSLQKAHENAALVDFDYQIIQDSVIEGIMLSLKEEGVKLESLMLQEKDPSRFRYG